MHFIDSASISAIALSIVRGLMIHIYFGLYAFLADASAVIPAAGDEALAGSVRSATARGRVPEQLADNNNNSGTESPMGRLVLRRSNSTFDRSDLSNRVDPRSGLEQASVRIRGVIRYDQIYADTDVETHSINLYCPGVAGSADTPSCRGPLLALHQALPLWPLRRTARCLRLPHVDIGDVAASVRAGRHATYRVWVVEATRKSGTRHARPEHRYCMFGNGLTCYRKASVKECEANPQIIVGGR